MFGADLLAGFCECGGAGVDFGSPGLHEESAVGFLFVAAFDHVDAALEVEEVAGEREGRCPIGRRRFR